MKFSKEQARAAYQKLSPEMQSFTMDPEITDAIAMILGGAGLDDDQADSADSEILYAMYGLQSLSEAMLNIGKIIGKSTSELSKLRGDLEAQIWAKMPGSASAVRLDENRIADIAQKYSLRSDQTQKLIELSKEKAAKNTVPAEFLKSVIADLGISQLIGEQIVEDMENKVFNQAPKSQREASRPAAQPVQQPTQQGSQMKAASAIPEIRPDTVPMVEKSAPRPYAPPVAAQRMTPPSMRSPEPVQKPYGVPRFGASSIPPKVETLNLNQTKPTTPQEAMEAKMSNVTVNIGDNFAPQQPSQQAPKAPDPTANPAANPIRKSYTTDPYREPLN